MAVDSYEDLIRRGVRAQRAGEFDAAASCYRAAQAKDPHRPEALHYLGLLLGARGARDEAIGLIERSIALAPERAAFHCNLGTVLDEAGRAEDAVDAYRRALALEPDYALAQERLGAILYRRGRYAEAERAFAALARSRPNSALAFRELSKCLVQQARFAEAEAACRRLVAIEPESGDAHLSLAFCRLSRGELAGGFDDYEWRWRAPGFAWRPRPFAQPPWTGSPIRDGALLLWSEQGVGDELLHAGLASEAVTRAGRCILECDPRLAPLFARSFAGIEVVPRENPPHARARASDIAAQCPTGSLPRLFRRRFEDFPSRPSYLRADAARTAGLRARYKALGLGPLIGIAWRSKSPSVGAAKTTALADWAPILATPGVTFVNLQYGDCAAELAAIRGTLGIAIHHDPTIDQMSDLDGFAAQVAALDLVVSVSNTTAHVAGALGKPAWVLLPEGAGAIWYWFLGRDDSPWYPSLRLFRQPAPGAWSPVIDRVAAELATLARS